MLTSNLSACSDGYIVVKGTNNANTRNKKLAFMNNAPFWSCLSKINNTYIDNAENLDIVMPMNNLLGIVTIILRHLEVCWIIIGTK